MGKFHAAVSAFVPGGDYNTIRDLTFALLSEMNGAAQPVFATPEHPRILSEATRKMLLNKSNADLESLIQRCDGIEDRLEAIWHEVCDDPLAGAPRPAFNFARNHVRNTYFQDHAQQDRLNLKAIGGLKEFCHAVLLVNADLPEYAAHPNE